MKCVQNTLFKGKFMHAQVFLCALISRHACARSQGHSLEGTLRVY